MEKLTPNQREFKIHVAAVEHIKSCFPGLLFFHIPGRPGDATDGYFKKLMGAEAGASDLLFSWNDGMLRVGVIELKAEGGRLSTQQNKFFSKFSHIGWRTAIAWSVQDVHNTLKKWGHKPKYESVMEPDLRSWDEKTQDAINAFAPPKHT